MPVGPDLLVLAVPSAAGVTGRSYHFLAQEHRVEDVALGPEGEVPFSMDDWIGGLPSVAEGLEYRELPKYVGARGVDASVAHQAIIQPVATTIALAGGAEALGAPIKQVDFVPSGGSINTYLVQESRYLHRLNGSNQWTRVYDVGSGNTIRDVAVADNLLVMGVGPSILARSSADGATWATLTIYADRWAAVNDQLWRAVRPNQMFNTLFSSDPWAWSSAYEVSDISYDINSLTPVEQLLMIGKEDGIYAIGSDGSTVPYTPELRPQAHDDMASQRASAVFNGDYFFRTLNGLMTITSEGVKDRIGFDQHASPDIPTPVIKALTSDDRFLYAICDNTSNGLMILRRSVQGAWHPWYWDGAAGRASHIAYSGALGYPAIFFSYYDGANYVTRFIRTSTFANPLDDTNYRFDTGSGFYIRFPRIGSAEARMVIDRIIVQSLNATASRTILFEISVDGGAWQTFGTVTTSPYETLSAATPFTGNYFDLRATLTTNSATTSPVLKGFSVKGVLRPERRRVHTFTISLARGDDSARQGTLARNPSRQIDDIQTVRGVNVYFNVKDELGREFQGLLIDVKRGTQGRNLAEPAPQAATIIIAEKA